MLQNANRHGRPTVVVAGKYVAYGKAWFYRTADGKLYTVGSYHRYNPMLGKLTIVPQEKK